MAKYTQFLNTHINVFTNENIIIYKATSFNTYFNPYPAKVIYLNFQPLEVVGRGQVAENYSYLLNLSTNISKSLCDRDQ